VAKILATRGLHPASESRLELARVDQSKQPSKGVVRGNAVGQGQILSQPIKLMFGPHVQLIETMIFLLLVANVLPTRCLISTYGRHKVSSRPEALTSKILLPLSVHPRQVNRALAFDETNHLRHRVFRRYRDHHVDVVRTKMSFLDPALLFARPASENLAKMLTQLPLQHLPSAFRYKYYVVLALPLRVAKTLEFVHPVSP
jgi:hypothetical protein